MTFSRHNRTFHAGQCARSVHRALAVHLLALNVCSLALTVFQHEMSVRQLAVFKFQPTEHVLAGCEDI